MGLVREIACRGGHPGGRWGTDGEGSRWGTGDKLGRAPAEGGGRWVKPVLEGTQ